jgi:hypothetical protein
MVANQMKRPDAPVIARIRYGEVRHGFMKDAAGRIFFLTSHGQETIPSQVLEDGTVLSRSNLEGLQHPYQFVDLVNPKDVGIDVIHLRWTEAPA